MRVPHGTWVLVTDGSKALFLRNEGDARFPDLQFVAKWEQTVPPDRELKSSGPGHAFSSFEGGSRRSAYEETNFHDQAEIEFTGRVAEFLGEQARLNAIEQLIIIAPSRTLGRLRKHVSRSVSERVTAEIAKDLVKHPVAAIEDLLQAHGQDVPSGA